ncbi:unnamed protein product [Auanema sp. JU1783]|nr:unnamed protein product [Auanema sp. JU1783]
MALLFRPSCSSLNIVSLGWRNLICSTSTFTGIIPTEAIEKRFSLSRGPGGQNVQKNATKAEIRFNLKSAEWIPEQLKEPLSDRLHNRINTNGEVIINSDRTAERSLNLADCFDKLRFTIYEVQRDLSARTTTEEDVLILRKKAEKAAQQRLAEKRRLQDKRKLRSNTEF